MQNWYRFWTLFCSIDLFDFLYTVLKLLIPMDLGFEI